MSAPTSKAVILARRKWMKAPEGKKPTALELAKQYKVHESTIHRAREKWRKEAQKPKGEENAAT